MNTPSYKRHEEIFWAAIELSPEERRAYFDAECGKDRALHDRMEELIASHEADDFMPTPASPLDFDIEERIVRLEAEVVGQQIGNYKLIEKIGEGGFGTVWLAEQKQPLRRKVAFKIIKLGMDTRAVIGRFEQERQALAVMDHPNIAKVFDAGATQFGRPYFVMELVHGTRITDYCDDAKLSMCERLNLFVAVCQAVQHAHQKGIIHRDLKPSNILVTLQDGISIPKVIDFGVAKAMHGRLTDETIATELEQVVGTPLYMSPEQAEMSGVDVDTRSDIYSLGVLLYELLIGKTPFTREDMRKAGCTEIRRIICEIEPSKPSAALQSMAYPSASVVAARRHSEPSKLVRLIHGDLDWIVIKALEKDRSRRYETANALCVDIQNYLSNKPVNAGPPSASYRAGKLIRRHKAAFIAGAAVALALVLGILGTLWQAHRANENAIERNIAAVNAETAAEKAKSLVREASRSHYANAQLRLMEGKWQLGVAYLARSIRYDPENRIAQDALFMTLLNGKRDAGRLPLHEFEHVGPSALAAFSPDGSHVLTLTSDKSVQIWSSNSGQPVGAALQHEGPVSKVSFSPDGTRVLTVALRSRSGNEKNPTAKDSAEAQIWDVKTGQPIGDPLQHKSSIREAKFSPDGSFVLTASYDRTARIWDAGTGLQSGPPLKHDSMVYGAEISPDSKRVITNTLKAVWVWDAKTGQQLVDPLNHGGIISEAIFSPNGSRILTAERGGTAYIWDGNTFQSVCPPLQHGRQLEGVQFSPDSLRAITFGGKVLRIWNAVTGQLVCSTEEDESHVTTAVFSPDNTRVVCASKDWDSARILDSATGSSLGTLLKHGAGIASVVFSPDGSRVLTASSDKTARIWDAKTGHPVGVPFHHEAPVRSVVFSPDGSRVLTTGDDRITRLWDAAWAQPLGVVLAPGADVIFCPDGSRVINVHRDQTARIWDATTGEPTSGSLSHADIVRAHFSAESSRVVTMGKGTARIWNATTGEPIGVPLQNRWRVESSPDGARVVTTGFDWAARIWSTRTGDRMGSPLQHDGFVRSALFSPDGSRVVTASRDGTARIWDASTGQSIGVPLKHNEPVILARFSPDNARIVTHTRQTAQLWDANNSRPIGSPLRHDRNRTIDDANFNGSGTRLLTIAGQEARIWTVDGQLIGKPLLHDDRIKWFSFSPDGSRLVTVTRQTAHLWDARSSEPIGALLRHEGGFANGGFSPDGSRLITASDDGTARIWDVKTGLPIGAPLLHEDRVNNAAFSPDGSRAATGSHDGTARVWETPPSTNLAPGIAERLSIFCAGAKLDPDLGTLLPVTVPERRALWKTLETDLSSMPAIRFAAEQTLSPIASRPISLGSTMTIRAASTRLLETGIPGNIETVLQIDPSHPLLPFALARSEASNQIRATWLCEYGIKQLPADLSPADLRLGARLLIRLADKLPDQKIHALALLDRAREKEPEETETKILRMSADGSEAARNTAYKEGTQAIITTLAEGRFDEAIELARRMTETQSERLTTLNEAEPEAWLANTLLLRSASVLGREDPKNAADTLREADEIIQRLRGRQVALGIGEARVDLLSRYGHWDQAVALCRPLYQETPLNAWVAFRLGMLLVETGQTEAYEALCQELLRSVVSSSPTGLTYSEFRDGHSLDVIVMTACLRPPTEANLPLVKRLAVDAIWHALDTEPNRSWFLMTKDFTNALVEYRAGNHVSAIAALEPLIPRLSPSASVSAQAVLAMAKSRVNKEAALTNLHAAESRFRDHWFSEKRIALEGNPHDWLVADILLREASGLLHGEK